ncbi:MAG: site-specific DNA-methyltransferase [Actinomycetota bacterium]|nr:site-specific DNA-methyltransferase [Actinomycetota bacterium]
MSDSFINQIFNQDCIIGLKMIPSESIDLCITDPPYNYEFIGHRWDANEVRRRLDRVTGSTSTLVKNVPYGSGLAGGKRDARWYERYRKNLAEYQLWSTEWALEVIRVLKPGAFICAFSSNRTVAHIQVALEEAGFYARDVIVWQKNSGIPKGLNYSKKLAKEGKDSSEWQGWHSALRNEWEAIAVLQKPLIDNYSKTIDQYGVGLFKAETEGGFASNIIRRIEAESKEKFNVHCTVKPVSLIKYLIELTLPIDRNRIVLDPFMGSGTTAVAALQLGVNFLGFEIFEEYVEVASKRIERFNEGNKTSVE